MFEDGVITVTRFGGGSSGVALAKITSVSIVNDQLVVNGSDLNGVTGVRITGPSSFDESFSIESKTGSNLIANGLNNVAFAMNGLFNLILTDAQGAATFQVTFTLQDGAVTASKLADMGAGVGQVLKYDGTNWGPSDLGALTYAGTWDSSTATAPNVAPSAGEYYIITVADTAIDIGDGSGARNFAVGDWLVYNDATSMWDKIDNATNVTSFEGRSGPVTAQAGDYTWAEIDKTSSVLSQIADVEAPAGDGSDTNKVLKWNNATSMWELADDLSGGGAGSVTSTEISDGAIVDADVNGAAAIAQTKIANLTTDLAAKVPLAGGTMTGDLTVPNLITSGNVDGVDVSTLSTSVGTNTTNIGNNATAIGALDTDDVSEGTALYFTDARAKASAVVNSTAGTETDQAASVASMKSYVTTAISGFGGGDFLADGTVPMTGNLDLGNNKLRLKSDNVNYVELIAPNTLGATYTLTMPSDDGTVGQVLSTDGSGALSWASSTSGTVTNVTGTAPIVSSGGATPAISIAQANGATDGFLDSADWTTFNNKQTAITTGTTAQYLRGDLSLATLQDDVRSTLLTGFASSAGTVAATDTILQAVNKLDGNVAGKEPVISTAATTTYFRGDKTFVTLDTSVVTENTNLYFTDTRAIAAPLTGFSSGAGTVAATDTVLEAIEKLDGNITSAGDILDGGNTKAATITIGTNDANSLELETNGTTKLTVLTDGQVGIGTNTPSSSLEVKSNLTTSLSGTVDVTSGAATVTGTATSFDTELRVGDAIQIASETFTVSAIASSTSLTLDSNHGVGATGATAFSDPSLLSLNNGDDVNLLTIDKSGYLGVGVSTPTERLDVDGALLLRPKGTSTGETGQVNFRELASNGSDTITLRSPDALAASYNLTLPNTDGNSGEVLTTDGSGSLSWAPAEAATSVSAGAGAVGTPSMSFSTDTNTGFYSSGADQVGVATNGVNTFNFTTTALASPTIGGATITTGNGTAAAPTFSFAGDEDTGWFRAAANELAASTAGSERIRIDSSGNVGIGTTSPNTNLEVSDGSGGRIRAGGAAGSGFEFNDANTLISIPAGNTMAFTTAATERVRIDSSGNVGIGTTSPESKLHIFNGESSGAAPNAESGLVLENNTNSYLQFLSSGTSESGVLFGDADNDVGAITYDHNTNKLRIRTNAVSDRMVIDDSGNVGIGTTAPTTTLDINSTSTTVAGLRVKGGSSQGAGDLNDGEILLGSGGGSAQGVISYDWSLGDLFISNSWNDANGDIHFQTRTQGTKVDALSILGSGNVGIGTTAPSTKLEVASSNNGITLGGPEGYLSIKNTNSGTTGALSGIGFSVNNSANFGAKILASNNNSNGSANLLFVNRDTLGAESESMRINSTGNVGIGTTSPSGKLHIQSGAAVNTPWADGDDLVIGNSGNTGLSLLSGAANSSTLYFGNAGSNVDGIIQYNNSDNSMRFATATGERVRIDSSGNVGIGTTSPTAKLHTTTATSGSQARFGGFGYVGQGPSGYPYFGHAVEYDGTNWNSLDPSSTGWAIYAPSSNRMQFGFIPASGSATDLTTALSITSNGVTSNVGIGTTAPSGTFEISTDRAEDYTNTFNPHTSTAELLITNTTDVSTTSTPSSIISFKAGDVGVAEGYIGLSRTGANAGNLIFGTATGATRAERMRIDELGNVGIGTTAPSQKLHVVGNLRVQGATDCTLGNGSGATNCTSDERLKDEITPIPNALEKIKSVKGVEFVWNDLARSPGRNDIGVIAQDIQKVFPTAVIENDEGYLSVDYAVLVSPLIESTKELDRNLSMYKLMKDGVDSEQTRRIASLENDNREIRAENQEIKAENQEIKAENQEIKAENQEIKAENQEIKGKYQKIESENREIKNQLDSIQSIICELKPSSLTCRK